MIVDSRVSKVSKVAEKVVLEVVFVRVAKFVSKALTKSIFPSGI